MNSATQIIEQIRAMVDNGRSVTALAREMGLPQNTLFRVVSGQNMPSFRTLATIEKYVSTKQSQEVQQREAGA